MIRAEQLVIGYRKPLALPFDFSAAPGEILALIGPNGSGKSTLLKTITGRIPALGGTVYLNGQPLSSVKEPEKQLAVLFTERNQTEYMTCYDVVSMGRYPYTGRLGILSQKDHQVVSDTMERVRVEELADRPFTEISDGQRQRVLLARALCQEPKLLVLDEPTSYLDVRYRLELLETLRELTKEQQLTVILSMHELDMVKRYADRVLCMPEAADEPIRSGRTEDVMEEKYLRELFQIPERYPFEI